MLMKFKLVAVAAAIVLSAVSANLAVAQQTKSQEQSFDERYPWSDCINGFKERVIPLEGLVGFFGVTQTEIVICGRNKNNSTSTPKSNAAIREAVSAPTACTCEFELVQGKVVPRLSDVLGKINYSTNSGFASQSFKRKSNWVRPLTTGSSVTFDKNASGLLTAGSCKLNVTSGQQIDISTNAAGKGCVKITEAAPPALPLETVPTTEVVTPVTTTVATTTVTTTSLIPLAAVGGLAAAAIAASEANNNTLPPAPASP